MKRIIKISLLIVVVAIAAVGGKVLYLRNCDWDAKAAATYATTHAEKRSKSLCALYVRKAIIAGGIPLHQGGDAWTYKYILPILGFEEIDKNEKKQEGDIVVFQPIGKRWFGHIAMWNGKQWVSDFKQRNLIVHSDYFKEGCEYAIFRKE